MKPITKKLLTIEDQARRFFERTPFIQAFFAGVGVIIFWRGIWELLDQVGISPGFSVVIGALILGGVGVFVQTFIGNTIIIKEVKQEEKIEKKTLQKMEGDSYPTEITLDALSRKIDTLADLIKQK
jgi:hypothetical protein